MSYSKNLLSVCLNFITTLEFFEKERILTFLNKCSAANSSDNMEQHNYRVFLIVLLQERFFKKMLMELKQNPFPFSTTCRYNFYPSQLFNTCNFILDNTYDVFHQNGHFDEYAGLCLIPNSLFPSNKEIECKIINVNVDKDDIESLFEQAIKDNYSRLNDIWGICDVLENMELEIDLEQFLENDDYVEHLISDNSFLAFLVSEIIDLCNIGAALEELYIDEDSLYEDVSSMILSQDFIDELYSWNINIVDSGKYPIWSLYSIISNINFHDSYENIDLIVYRFPLIQDYYDSKKQGINKYLDQKIDFLLEQFKNCIESTCATLYYKLEKGIVIFLFYDFSSTRGTSMSELHVSIMFNIYIYFINTVIKIRNNNL